jgi:ABC-type multidrug transport system permease subunit
MIGRILAVAHARNLEFLRDRSVLMWNLVLPILLAVGLAVVFSGPPRATFKVAVIADAPDVSSLAGQHGFLQTQFIDFYTAADTADVVDKLEHHLVDLVFDPATQPSRYWVNEQSPSGYLVEKILLGVDPVAERQTVSGDALRHIDWLFPGILGMNLMFSSLFGVGYVVVRYRKNGFLKRLSATPLRALEFVVAQILSRLMLVIVTTGLIFTIAGNLLDVRMNGSYVLLFGTLLLGAIALIAMGFLISARVSSEELAGGLLNMLSWPMMVLSGVWFSLEGRAEWLVQISNLLPLTHALQAARGIMLDGDGLAAIGPHWAVLIFTAVVCLAVGSWTFRWRES